MQIKGEFWVLNLGKPFHKNKGGWVSEFRSFQVFKGGREGGPMRGLELIMGPQGQ